MIHYKLLDGAIALFTKVKDLVWRPLSLRVLLSVPEDLVWRPLSLRVLLSVPEDLVWRPLSLKRLFGRPLLGGKSVWQKRSLYNPSLMEYKDVQMACDSWKEISANVGLKHAQPLENHKLKRVRRHNCVKSRSCSCMRRPPEVELPWSTGWSRLASLEAAETRRRLEDGSMSPVSPWDQKVTECTEEVVRGSGSLSCRRETSEDRDSGDTCP
ncbi:unnamed protein product [Pleuronectes platessa]|uniref:Uncharacterized protein n=1 Tax=Pleuronectes platessa TaxID=8262 RepID=A0A9N7YM17_PLEPL|nr:unnamed protein product [Pleuronectes platessa]